MGARELLMMRVVVPLLVSTQSREKLHVGWESVVVGWKPLANALQGKLEDSKSLLKIGT